jgi:hypothetical protein
MTLELLDAEDRYRAELTVSEWPASQSQRSSREPSGCCSTDVASGWPSRFRTAAGF